MKMWVTFIATCIFTSVYSKIITKYNSTIFRDEQIIFASNYNITKVLVPADGNKYVHTDSSEIPSIFFTVSDSKLEGGSCIYVLEGLAAYEILEGGRDSTAGYNPENTIYFGARDGLYKYSPDSLSAKKFGPFRDDIIQLQKANGSDAIFILTTDHKLYKIHNNGTVKTRVTAVTCAVQFVLDTSDNIYYESCDDHLPHIIKSNGVPVAFMASVVDDYKEIQLLRPAFVMEDCIPFFADGNLNILHSNGTLEKKDFYIQEKPSAYSVDASLYIIAALNGKIYEFNVMEILLKSMFGIVTEWPNDITKIVMSIIETAKDSYHRDISNIL